MKERILPDSWDTVEIPTQHYEQLYANTYESICKIQTFIENTVQKVLREKKLEHSHAHL